MMKGWLYVIWCDAAPDLSKIGFSKYEPQLRLEELETTGVPGKLFLACSYLVDDAPAIESFIHKSLEDHRDHKEWFNITAAKAVAMIDGLLGENILFRELHIDLAPKPLHVEGREISAGAESGYLDRLRREYAIKFHFSKYPESEDAPEYCDQSLDDARYAVCEASDSQGRQALTWVCIDYDSVRRECHESVYKNNARVDAQNKAELAMVRKLIRL